MIDEEPREVAPQARDVRAAGIAIAALIAVAALAAIDLATDARAGVAAGHAVLEGGIVVLATGGAVALARSAWRWRAQRDHARAAADTLARDVARAEADAARWKAEAGDLVKGLADAIDRQLAAWNLTASEQEVARLLLKGLAHKEIATIRAASEATVRQQAAAVYRKAGLAGRAELAAFFLEDLLDRPGDRAATS